MLPPRGSAKFCEFLRVQGSIPYSASLMGIYQFWCKLDNILAQCEINKQFPSLCKTSPMSYIVFVTYLLPVFNHFTFFEKCVSFMIYTTVAPTFAVYCWILFLIIITLLYYVFVTNISCYHSLQTVVGRQAEGWILLSRCRQSDN